MRNLTIVALAVVVLAGCATVFDEDGALAVVPYRVGDKGQLIVQAHINGQGPFDFAVDTGASISVVFDKLLRRIGPDTVPLGEATIHGMVASGDFPLIGVDSYDIGGENWRNARMVVLPGDSPVCADIDGIVGLDFLRRYALGVFPDEGALRLYPPSLVSRRSYEGWSSIPLRTIDVSEASAPLYAFDIRIRTRDISAMLDLGAGLNMLNTRAADLLELRLPRLRRGEGLTGAVDSMPVRLHYVADRLRAGNLYWFDVEFLVADLEVLEILGLHKRPTAIVGARFFKGRAFVVDFGRNRLLVRRPLN